MKVEIKIKEYKRQKTDYSYMWFYILMTIYSIILSIFLFKNVGDSKEQLNVIICGFVMPFVILFIADYISRISIKKIK